MYTVRASSVASTNPLTAGRIGAESSIKDLKSVPPIWQSARLILNFYSRGRGTRGVLPGVRMPQSIGPVAVFSDLRTLGRVGPGSTEKVCQKGTGDVWGSMLLPTADASTH